MQTILFLCPHGAAKSVLAAAYCQRLVERHGLSVRITSAGAEPDAVIAPAVVERLHAEGLPTPDGPPRLVTREELASASRIVSLGCNLSDLLPPGKPIEHWHDVPAVGVNLNAACDDIRARVEKFVAELKPL